MVEDAVVAYGGLGVVYNNAVYPKNLREG